MAEDRMNEAMEKLNRGIQEARRTAQRQAMELAQDYLGDSIETLRRQVGDSRAALEDLPRQVPGGEEGSFQSLFQELMANCGAIEECLDEAQQNVSNLDTEQLRGEGELDASDAARREAEELGVDLSQVEASGSGGRIIVSDVVEASKDAARREAEEQGVDLSQIEGEGSGPGGLITVEDVTSIAEGTQEQAAEGTGQAAQGAQDTAGDTAQQVQATAGQAADQAQDGLGQVTDQVGQAAQGVQNTAGQAAQQAQDNAGQSADQVGQETGEDGAEEPKVTNAARRKAEELGVDLSRVQGTGAGGLITLKDVRGS